MLPRQAIKSKYVVRLYGAYVNVKYICTHIFSSCQRCAKMTFARMRFTEETVLSCRGVPRELTEPVIKVSLCGVDANFTTNLAACSSE